MPGRISPRESLQKVDEIQIKLNVGLEDHFNREETALLKAFQEYGQPELFEALKSLLNDHKMIRSDLNELKRQVGELMTGKLSRNLWESSGYELRARINRLHKTIATHASDEQLLLHEVQLDIKKRNQ